MLSGGPHIYVALPVMAELDWLPGTLDAIAAQRYRDFSVVICINQPDDWWNDPTQSLTCLNNRDTLELLHNESRFPLLIIDRTSPGAGWKGKQYGVGWARKTVMDAISRQAGPADIILSLDADTLFSARYFGAVAQGFMEHPAAVALTVPYFHPLPDDAVAARAILRYEVYMRHYLLNLIRIGSPYAFTAIGSAMAAPVWAYRKVGGMTPKYSGEDFYFLQKLKKTGPLLTWIGERVFPAARFSSRVFFGTGPAMIRGVEGGWESYPIYSGQLFDAIAESYESLPEQFDRVAVTPVTRFLQERLGEPDPFASLRDNFRERELFVKACHEKFDGLRILQFLKHHHALSGKRDEQALLEWLKAWYARKAGSLIKDLQHFSFNDSPIGTLDRLRKFLEKEEDLARQSHPLL